MHIKHTLKFKNRISIGSVVLFTPFGLSELDPITFHYLTYLYYLC